MQIKTTMRHHLIPIRKASIKKTRNKSVGEDVDKKEPSATVVNWCSHYGKQVPQKTKNKKTILSNNSITEYLPKENENNSKRYMPSCV